MSSTIINDFCTKYNCPGQTKPSFCNNLNGGTDEDTHNQKTPDIPSGDSTEMPTTNSHTFMGISFCVFCIMMCLICFVVSFFGLVVVMSDTSPQQTPEYNYL